MRVIPTRARAAVREGLDYLPRRKMLRPGCALPFTSGPLTRPPILQSATEPDSSLLKSTTILIADFVCVNRCASATGNRANDCAFLSTNQTAQKRTTYSAPRRSDLVAMVIPNGTVAAITIIVVIDVVVVPAVISTVIDRTIRPTRASLRRHRQCRHAKNYDANKSGN
jgi:hypothetical protein